MSTPVKKGVLGGFRESFSLTNLARLGTLTTPTQPRTIVIKEPYQIISDSRVVKETGTLRQQLDSNISEITKNISSRKMEKLPEFRESDVGMASTTPLLGQYSSFFGWPDDWAYYWEYLDCSMYVPEIRKAIGIKQRLIWRAGWEIDSEDEDESERLERTLRNIGFEYVFREGSKTALKYGNFYCETVDNSIVRWSQGQALNPTIGFASPVTVTYHKPADILYGFKPLDSRTVRVEVNPDEFDPDTHEPKRIKFVQQRWQGPVNPTQAQQIKDKATGETYGNQIYFHPDQMIHLRFNRIDGGIYGYSMFRETYFPLKAYLVMIQYIPAIFYKRADPMLLIRFGGEIINEMGQKEVWWPRTDDEFQAAKSRVSNRALTEDMYADIMTSVEEVYKNQGNLKGLEALLQVWKERIMMGLGIPPVLSETKVASVRWGDLKYEDLLDEVREYQAEIEYVVNSKIIPRLTTDETVRFRFKKIKQDDYLALMRAALPPVQFGIVNKRWFVDTLEIDPKYMKGAEPMIGLSANPLKGGIGGMTSNPNRTKSPNASSKSDKPSTLSKPKDEQPKGKASNPTGKREDDETGTVTEDEAAGALE